MFRRLCVHCLYLFQQMKVVCKSTTCCYCYCYCYCTLQCLSDKGCPAKLWRSLADCGGTIIALVRVSMTPTPLSNSLITRWKEIVQVRLTRHQPRQLVDYVQWFPRLIWRWRSTRCHVITYEVMHAWPHHDRSSEGIGRRSSAVLDGHGQWRRFARANYQRLRRQPSSRRCWRSRRWTPTSSRTTGRCPTSRFFQRSSRELLLSSSSSSYKWTTCYHIFSRRIDILHYCASCQISTLLLTARMSHCSVF